MINEFAVQTEIQQRERELVARIEHRRVAAERAAKERGVSRLAMMARQARVGRAAPGVHASC